MKVKTMTEYAIIMKGNEVGKMYLIFSCLINGSPTNVWLWVAIAFVIIEIITVGIVSIWFAIGALAAIITSLFTDQLFIQILVFIIVSAFSLMSTRKIVVEKLKIGQQKTNIDELIGEECVVVAKIDPNKAGEVKLQGKYWRAVSETNQFYEVGELVTVLRIEGVTIVVK